MIHVNKNYGCTGPDTSFMLDMCQYLTNSTFNKKKTFVAKENLTSMGLSEVVLLYSGRQLYWPGVISPEAIALCEKLLKKWHLEFASSFRGLFNFSLSFTIMLDS